MNICLWVRAMDTYATVYRIVEPKRQVLAAAQAALDASNAALAQKQQQLQAIRDKVAALQQQLTDTQKQLAALQFQVRCCTPPVHAALHQRELQNKDAWKCSVAPIMQLGCMCVVQAELCNKRLGRAGKLTNLLSDELVRWGWYCHCRL